MDTRPILLASVSAASAGVDKQVIVYFNKSVLELPEPGARVAPTALASCNPSLPATFQAHGVELISSAVPAFDRAETLLTTPGGRSIKMPDLSRLFVIETVNNQRNALVDALRGDPGVVFAEKDVDAVTRVIPNDTRFHPSSGP